jgi:hypothetical protein
VPRQRNVEARIEHDPVPLRGTRWTQCAHSRVESAPRHTDVTRLAHFDWRRWFDWWLLISSVGLVVLALWGPNPSLWQTGRDERLLQAGQRLVDLASADHQIVKPWLSTSLPSPRQCRNRTRSRRHFSGGRGGSLEDRSVAALVYRQRDHVVDVFVWPTADDEAPITTASLREFTRSLGSQRNALLHGVRLASRATHGICADTRKRQ